MADAVVLPVIVKAPAPAPPADMAVEPTPVDKKDGDKPEVTSAETKTNGAPEAVMEEPKGAADALPEKEPTNTDKPAGATDEQATEASDNPKDIDMKDAAEKRKGSQPEQVITNGRGQEETAEKEWNDDLSPEIKATTAPVGKKRKANSSSYKQSTPAIKARRGKKEKMRLAVGKTERRTRSQGLA